MDGPISNILELSPKIKWKGMESKLSLDDISSLSLKETATQKIENSKFTEYQNDQGQLSRVEGPATINANATFMQWIKEDKLIASYENGKLYTYPHGEDGPKNQIKVDFKGRPESMSLEDIYCSRSFNEK